MNDAGWSGSGRYVAGAVLGWIMFLAAVFAIVYGRSEGWPLAVLLGLALVPAIIAGAQFRWAYRSIVAEDEYVRALTAKRLIVAGGAAMTIVIGWSVGQMAGLPYLPAWLIYPLFWGLYGVATPLVRDSRP